ncbi:hypothetical protein H4R34_005101 [Dimargaris verticillata]|uniref:Carrier domain-containing protein n=1 Tax=Dimargaris verticillata TaxID=2761393 RepID=A0A9W8B193_9FUNG|nr:hypothetical protein H4R34_005101 [Dimargaris verticillata]
MSIRGRLNVAHFQSAWNRLIAQHAILRTRFLLQPFGQRQTMLQVVLKAWQPTWTLGQWHGPETAHREHQAHIASLAQPFYLTQPLLRLGLFSAGSQDHRLVFTIHHAMIDGWSLSLLIDSLIQQYMELEPGTMGCYGHVAQHVWAQDLDSSHQFWSEHLSTVTAPSYLPSPTVDAARMAALAFVPDCFETFGVTMDNVSALVDMAQHQGVTLSTVLRAALAVLLQYYSGQDHVLFGVTVSGRNVPIRGIEGIIGPCINTLPCVATITPETTVADLLATLHNESTLTVPYEHSRLTDIHRCTRINTELALFNVLLVVQNYPESLKLSSSPLSIAIDSAQQNAEYPLTLVASTEANRLHVQLTFRTDVFPVDYVRQVGHHYLAALASLLKSPATTHIHRLTLLSLAEQTLLLDTYATNPRPCPVHYAHQYFETQVHHSPNAIALRDHAQSYTYSQVHCLAQGLAYRLVQNTAVGRDRTVVIVADLSACLVIAQLAVWMSGGAFVVIDPQQPLARKQFIVADSQCVAVVGLTHDCDPITNSLPVVPLDHLSSQRLPPDAWALPTPDPTALAWVVYTSGTTGQPKGVQVEHQSAAHHLHAAHVWPDLQEATTTHTFFTPAFDAAISELWIPLSLGGTVLVSRRDHLATLSQITRLSCSGSFLSTLDGTECPQVRTVVTGGERVTQGMVDTWADRVCLVNIYGPTEVTIATHAARLRPSKRPVIGKPLANAIGYILDQYQRPVPIGAVGELYLGGPGVARGYLNRPELTASKFIPNPFGPGRLFKSGDLARWLPGGEVECLGRQDDQVKLRGYRVELGEVTHALTQHPDVRQACVVMRNDQLIGYVSPSTVKIQAVLMAVAGKVPQYMVPTALVALDALPLTPAGKVDKRALPQYTPVKTPTASWPLSDETTDAKLLPILAQVLDKPLDAAALDQTFFQLGGNSLLAFQLVARCRRAGMKLTIADITRTTTILQLSQL